MREFQQETDVQQALVRVHVELYFGMLKRVFQAFSQKYRCLDESLEIDFSIACCLINRMMLKTQPIPSDKIVEKELMNRSRNEYKNRMEKRRRHPLELQEIEE
jgi:hypothetical protein